MRARVPEIQLSTVHDYGKRQSAANSLRQNNKVRQNSRSFKRVHGSGTAPAGLHLIEDQRNLLLVTHAADISQPLRWGGNYSTFALHGFEDDSGRQSYAALRIAERHTRKLAARTVRALLLAHRAAIRIRIRVKMDFGHQSGNLRPQIPHQRQCTMRLPVITASESNHPASTRCRLHEFDCR